MAGQARLAPLASYSYAVDTQDPAGLPNLATHINPASQTRSYQWANHMLVGRYANPLNQTTAWTHNGQGDPLTRTAHWASASGTTTTRAGA